MKTVLPTGVTITHTKQGKITVKSEKYDKDRKYQSPLFASTRKD